MSERYISQLTEISYSFKYLYNVFLEIPSSLAAADLFPLCFSILEDINCRVSNVFHLIEFINTFSPGFFFRFDLPSSNKEESLISDGKSSFDIILFGFV